MSYNIITDQQHAIGFGRIIGYKPRYKNSRRIGYIVTMQLERKVHYMGKDINIFIQYLYFSGSNEVLRELKESNQLVKIIGKKRNYGQRIYRNKGDRTVQSLWIFLEPDPIPRLEIVRV